MDHRGCHQGKLPDKQLLAVTGPATHQYRLATVHRIPRGRHQYGELVGRMVGTRLAQDEDVRPDLFVLMTNKENLQGERPIPYLEIFQEAVFFLPPVPTRRHRHMRVVVLPFA